MPCICQSLSVRHIDYTIRFCIIVTVRTVEGLIFTAGGSYGRSPLSFERGTEKIIILEPLPLFTSEHNCVYRVRVDLTPLSKIHIQ